MLSSARNLRGLRKWRQRLVKLNPGQFVFEPDRFLRCKWCRVVERRDGYVDRFWIFRVLEKQMGAATCSKRTNPIRIRNFARLTFCDDEIFARHRSPRDIGRTRASAAIDAMTIDQSKRPTLQHVSCPAANASASQLHKIRLAQFNHELTRMNTNLGSACVSSAGCGVPPQRTSPNRWIRKPGSQENL